MPERTYKDIIGEFRVTLRADLGKAELEAQLATLRSNAPVFDVIDDSNINIVMEHNEQVKSLQSDIATLDARIKQKSKIITAWLTQNNLASDQKHNISFDNDTTVVVRILEDDNSKPYIDHSLNPASELYTEPAP